MRTRERKREQEQRGAGELSVHQNSLATNRITQARLGSATLSKFGGQHILVHHSNCGIEFTNGKFGRVMIDDYVIKLIDVACNYHTYT